MRIVLGKEAFLSHAGFLFWVLGAGEPGGGGWVGRRGSRGNAGRGPLRVRGRGRMRLADAMRGAGRARAAPPLRGMRAVKSHSAPSRAVGLPRGHPVRTRGLGASGRRRAAGAGGGRHGAQGVAVALPGRASARQRTHTLHTDAAHAQTHGAGELRASEAVARAPRPQARARALPSFPVPPETMQTRAYRRRATAGGRRPHEGARGHGALGAGAPRGPRARRAEDARPAAGRTPPEAPGGRGAWPRPKGGRRESIGRGPGQAHTTQGSPARARPPAGTGGGARGLGVGPA
jgi:hypothetical protein